MLTNRLLGNGVDEATKIHYFKSNIFDLENSLSLARTKEQSNFAIYVAFQTTEVNLKQTKKRQILIYKRPFSFFGSGNKEEEIKECNFCI